MALRTVRQNGDFEGTPAPQQPQAQPKAPPQKGEFNAPLSCNNRLYNLSDDILHLKKPTQKELNDLKSEAVELRKHYQAHERKDVDSIVRLLLSVENSISAGNFSGLKASAAELKMFQALGELESTFIDPSKIGSDPGKAATVQAYCVEIAALARHLPPALKEKAEGFASWVGAEYVGYSRKLDDWFVKNPKSSRANAEKFRKDGEDNKAKAAFNILYSSLKTEVVSSTEMPAAELQRRMDRIYASAEATDRGLKDALGRLDFGDHLLNSSWLDILKTGALLNMGIDIGEIGNEKLRGVYKTAWECEKNYKGFEQCYLEFKSALQGNDPARLSESVGKLSQAYLALSYSQAKLAVLAEDYDLKGFEYVMPALSKAMDVMMAVSLATGVGAVATLGRAGLKAALMETGEYMLEKGMASSLRITFAFFTPEVASDIVSSNKLAEAEQIAQKNQLNGLQKLSAVLQNAKDSRQGAKNAGEMDRLIGDINSTARDLETQLKSNPGYKLDLEELATLFLISYGQMLLFEAGFGLMREAKVVSAKRKQVKAEAKARDVEEGPDKTFGLESDNPNGKTGIGKKKPASAKKQSPALGIDETLGRIKENENYGAAAEKAVELLVGKYSGKKLASALSDFEKLLSDPVAKDGLQAIMSKTEGVDYAKCLKIYSKMLDEGFGKADKPDSAAPIGKVNDIINSVEGAMIAKALGWAKSIGKDSKALEGLEGIIKSKNFGPEASACLDRLVPLDSRARTIQALGKFLGSDKYTIDYLNDALALNDAKLAATITVFGEYFPNNAPYLNDKIRAINRTISSIKDNDLESLESLQNIYLKIASKYPSIELFASLETLFSNPALTPKLANAAELLVSDMFQDNFSNNSDIAVFCLKRLDAMLNDEKKFPGIGELAAKIIENSADEGNSPRRTFDKFNKIIYDYSTKFIPEHWEFISSKIMGMRWETEPVLDALSSLYESKNLSSMQISELFAAFDRCKMGEIADPATGEKKLVNGLFVSWIIGRNHTFMSTDLPRIYEELKVFEDESVLRIMNNDMEPQFKAYEKSLSVLYDYFMDGRSQGKSFAETASWLQSLKNDLPLKNCWTEWSAMLHENLKIMSELEAYAPGAVKFLVKERGIVNFSRWGTELMKYTYEQAKHWKDDSPFKFSSKPESFGSECASRGLALPETELAKASGLIRKGDKCQVESGGNHYIVEMWEGKLNVYDIPEKATVVVIASYADNNLGFNVEFLMQKYVDMSKDTRLDINEVDNTYAATRAIIKAHQQFGPIDISVVEAHGNVEIIRFSSNAVNGDLKVESVPGGGDLSKYFTINPSALFISCEQAADGAIATTMSGRFNGDFHAPANSSGLPEFRYAGRREDMSPALFVEWAERSDGKRLNIGKPVPFEYKQSEPTKPIVPRDMASPIAHIGVSEAPLFMELAAKYREQHPAQVQPNFKVISPFEGFDASFAAWSKTHAFKTQTDFLQYLVDSGLDHRAASIQKATLAAPKQKAGSIRRSVEEDGILEEAPANARGEKGEPMQILLDRGFLENSVKKGEWDIISAKRQMERLAFLAGKTAEFFISKEANEFLQSKVKEGKMTQEEYLQFAQQAKIQPQGIAPERIQDKLRQLTEENKRESAIGKQQPKNADAHESATDRRPVSEAPDDFVSRLLSANGKPYHLSQDATSSPKFTSHFRKHFLGSHWFSKDGNVKRFENGIGKRIDAEKDIFKEWYLQEYSKAHTKDETIAERNVIDAFQKKMDGLNKQKTVTQEQLDKITSSSELDGAKDFYNAMASQMAEAALQGAGGYRCFMGRYAAGADVDAPTTVQVDVLATINVNGKKYVLRNLVSYYDDYGAYEASSLHIVTDPSFNNGVRTGVMEVSFVKNQDGMPSINMLWYYRKIEYRDLYDLGGTAGDFVPGPLKRNGGVKNEQENEIYPPYKKTG